MKKMSAFYKPKAKRVKQLVRKLDDIHLESQRQRVRLLKSQRKNKSKQNHFLQELKLPRFSPTKISYEKFSTQSPISSGEKFLCQKQKIKILNSQRVFSSLPNMKISKLTKKPFSQTQNPVIRNLKFLQFDRITKQQSASHRIAKIKQTQQLILKNSFSSTKLYTLTHRLNLSCDYSDERKGKTSRLNESLCPSQLTNRLRNSIKDKEKQNVFHQALDSSNKGQFDPLNQSILNRSSLKRRKLTHLKSHKSEMDLQNLTKIPPISKFTLIKLQKNINSLTLK